MYFTATIKSQGAIVVITGWVFASHIHTNLVLRATQVFRVSLQFVPINRVVGLRTSTTHPHSNSILRVTTRDFFPASSWFFVMVILAVSGIYNVRYPQLTYFFTLFLFFSFFYFMSWCCGCTWFHNPNKKLTIPRRFHISNSHNLRLGYDILPYCTCYIVYHLLLPSL